MSVLSALQEVGVDYIGSDSYTPEERVFRVLADNLDDPVKLSQIKKMIGERFPDSAKNNFGVSKERMDVIRQESLTEKPTINANRQLAKAALETLRPDQRYANKWKRGVSPRREAVFTARQSKETGLELGKFVRENLLPGRQFNRLLTALGGKFQGFGLSPQSNSILANIYQHDTSFEPDADKLELNQVRSAKINSPWELKVKAPLYTKAQYEAVKATRKPPSQEEHRAGAEAVLADPGFPSYNGPRIYSPECRVYRTVADTPKENYPELIAMIRKHAPLSAVFNFGLLSDRRQQINTESKFDTEFDPRASHDELEQVRSAQINSYEALQAKNPLYLPTHFEQVVATRKPPTEEENLAAAERVLSDPGFPRYKGPRSYSAPSEIFRAHADGTEAEKARIEEIARKHAPLSAVFNLGLLSDRRQQINTESKFDAAFDPKAHLDELNQVRSAQINSYEALQAKNPLYLPTHFEQVVATRKPPTEEENSKAAQRVLSDPDFPRYKGPRSYNAVSEIFRAHADGTDAEKSRIEEIARKHAPLSAVFNFGLLGDRLQQINTESKFDAEFNPSPDAPPHPNTSKYNNVRKRLINTLEDFKALYPDEQIYPHQDQFNALLATRSPSPVIKQELPPPKAVMKSVEGEKDTEMPPPKHPVRLSTSPEFPPDAARVIFSPTPGSNYPLHHFLTSESPLAVGYTQSSPSVTTGFEKLDMASSAGSAGKRNWDGMSDTTAVSAHATSGLPEDAADYVEALADVLEGNKKNSLGLVFLRSLSKRIKNGNSTFEDTDGQSIREYLRDVANDTTLTVPPGVVDAVNKIADKIENRTGVGKRRKLELFYPSALVEEHSDGPSRLSTPKSTMSLDGKAHDIIKKEGSVYGGSDDAMSISARSRRESTGPWNAKMPYENPVHSAVEASPFKLPTNTLTDPKLITRYKSNEFKNEYLYQLSNSQIQLVYSLIGQRMAERKDQTGKSLPNETVMEIAREEADKAQQRNDYLGTFHGVRRDLADAKLDELHRTKLPAAKYDSKVMALLEAIPTDPKIAQAELEAFQSSQSYKAKPLRYTSDEFKQQYLYGLPSGEVSKARSLIGQRVAAIRDYERGGRNLSLEEVMPIAVEIAEQVKDIYERLNTLRGARYGLAKERMSLALEKKIPAKEYFGEMDTILSTIPSDERLAKQELGRFHEAKRQNRPYYPPSLPKQSPRNVSMTSGYSEKNPPPPPLFRPSLTPFRSSSRDLSGAVEDSPERSSPAHPLSPHSKKLADERAQGLELGFPSTPPTLPLEKIEKFYRLRREFIADSTQNPAGIAKWNDVVTYYEKFGERAQVPKVPLASVAQSSSRNTSSRDFSVHPRPSIQKPSSSGSLSPNSKEREAGLELGFPSTPPALPVEKIEKFHGLRREFIADKNPANKTKWSKVIGYYRNLK